MKKNFPVYYVCIILVICAISGLVYYYNNPLKKDIMFSGSGCVFYGEDMNEYEIVQVSVQGKRIYYLFENEPDAIQGEIWINGYGIFGHGSAEKYDSYIGGMYNEFPDDEEYSYCGNFVKETDRIKYVISKDGLKGIAEIDSDSEISNFMENKASGTVILVYPAHSYKEGKNLLDEMLQNLQGNDVSRNG